MYSHNQSFLQDPSLMLKIETHACYLLYSFERRSINPQRISWCLVNKAHVNSSLSVCEPPWDSVCRALWDNLRCFTHTHLRFKNPPVLRRRCVCIVALAMQVCFDRWIERWYHEYLPSPAHRRPSTKQLMMPCARTSSPCDWMSCNLSDHLIASHRKLGMLLSSCGKTYRP